MREGCSEFLELVRDQIGLADPTLAGEGEAILQALGDAGDVVDPPSNCTPRDRRTARASTRAPIPLVTRESHLLRVVDQQRNDELKKFLHGHVCKRLACNWRAFASRDSG